MARDYGPARRGFEIGKTLEADGQSAQGGFRVGKRDGPCLRGESARGSRRPPRSRCRRSARGRLPWPSRLIARRQRRDRGRHGSLKTDLVEPQGTDASTRSGREFTRRARSRGSDPGTGRAAKRVWMPLAMRTAELSGRDGSSASTATRNSSRWTVLEAPVAPVRRRRVGNSGALAAAPPRDRGRRPATEINKRLFVGSMLARPARPCGAPGARSARCAAPQGDSIRQQIGMGGRCWPRAKRSPDSVAAATVQPSSATPRRRASNYQAHNRGCSG